MKTNQILSSVPDCVVEKFKSIAGDTENQIFYRLISDPRMEKVYKDLQGYSQDEQLKFILCAMASARDAGSYEAVSAKYIKADFKTIAKKAKELAREIERIQKTGVELPIQLISPWSLLPTSYPIKIKVKNQKEIETKLNQTLEIETSMRLFRDRKNDPGLAEVINKIYRAADFESKKKPRFCWESEVKVKLPNKNLKKEFLRKVIFVRELGDYAASILEAPLHTAIAITATVALDMTEDISMQAVKDILRTVK